MDTHLVCIVIYAYLLKFEWDLLLFKFIFSELLMLAFVCVLSNCLHVLDSYSNVLIIHRVGCTVT